MSQKKVMQHGLVARIQPPEAMGHELLHRDVARVYGSVGSTWCDAVAEAFSVDLWHIHRIQNHHLIDVYQNGSVGVHIDVEPLLPQNPIGMPNVYLCTATLGFPQNELETAMGVLNTLLEQGHVLACRVYGTPQVQVYLEEGKCVREQGGLFLRNNGITLTEGCDYTYYPGRVYWRKIPLRYTSSGYKERKAKTSAPGS